MRWKPGSGIVGVLPVILVSCLWLLSGSATLTRPVAAARPAEVRDACTNPLIGEVSVTGATWKAQTFAPASSYNLAYVDLGGTYWDGATTLHIRGTLGGEPLWYDLASATISSGHRFILPEPLPLTAGTLYALVLSNDGGHFDWGYTASADCYPNPAGYPWTSLDGGSTWAVDMVDFHFTIHDDASAPEPTPTATPQPPTDAVVEPSVFVIAFPYDSTPLNDPQSHTETLIGLLAEGTRYHGYADPSARPYARYRIYDGVVHWASAMPPLTEGGNRDLGWVYDQYNLCALIQSGAVDEVWLWDAGQGGFAEWVMMGPEWSMIWGSTPPNCGKQVITMCYNYNREIDVALESYHHRMEGTLMHHVPCDFWTDTWPWQWSPPQCAGLVNDRTGFVARPFAGNDFIGGCGDAHCPPNILGTTAYIYDDHTTAQTICPDWSQDGSAAVTSVNCDAWGCTHWGYHIWWMQNLPGYRNTNRDRSGQPHFNWWTYVVGPPEEGQVYVPWVRH